MCVAINQLFPHASRTPALRSPYGLSFGASIDVAPARKACAYTASVSGTYTCRWHGDCRFARKASSISICPSPMRTVACAITPPGHLGTPVAFAPNAASRTGLIFSASCRCKYGCTVGCGYSSDGEVMYHSFPNGSRTPDSFSPQNCVAGSYSEVAPAFNALRYAPSASGTVKWIVTGEGPYCSFPSLISIVESPS